MCRYKERRNPDSGTSKTSCAQPPALRVSWAVGVHAELGAGSGPCRGIGFTTLQAMELKFHLVYLLLENNKLGGQHGAAIFGGVVGFLRTRTILPGCSYDPRDSTMALTHGSHARLAAVVGDSCLFTTGRSGGLILTESLPTTTTSPRLPSI